MEVRSAIDIIRSSRNFTALWLGQTLSQFGDAVLWITLPLAVFHSSSSALELGVIMGLFMLPQIVLLPFTGILADRVSRIRAMMVTDVIRFALVSAMAIVYVMHAMSPDVLGGFVLMYGAMEAVFNPAYSGARQQVFTPEIRTAAGVGAIASAYIYGRRHMWQRRAYIAYGGLAINALAILGLSFARATVHLMIVMAIASAGSMMFGVVWESSMQELVAPEAYGRAASLDYFGSWVMLPVGNILTGWLAGKIGGIHTIWAESIFMLLVTIVTMAVPAVRRFD